MYIFKNVEKNRCLEDQGTRAEWQNAWNNNETSTFAPAFVKDDPLLSNFKKIHCIVIITITITTIPTTKIMTSRMATRLSHHSKDDPLLSYSTTTISANIFKSVTQLQPSYLFVRIDDNDGGIYDDEGASASRKNIRSSRQKKLMGSKSSWCWLKNGERVNYKSRVLSSADWNAHAKPLPVDDENDDEHTGNLLPAI